MRRLVLEQPLSRAAIWSTRIALFSIVVTIYGILVVRGGQHGAPGLAALGSGFALAVLTLMTAFIGGVMIWSRGLKGAGRILVSMLIGLAILSTPAYLAFKVMTLPRLNDIATDIDDPPSFSRSRATLAARNGHVPLELARADRQPQREAYQRIAPIITELPAEEAFDVALNAARNMGWQVVEGIVPGGRSGIGRIEAISTTRVLRFTDDITIRVRPRADGSRIDIRSASRVGQHDLGANAARILAFTDEVQLLLSSK